MVPKSKDWVKRLNPDSKLPNFNSRRILVPESQTVNECLQPTEAPTDPESSKESGLKPQTPLPPLKNIQRASLSSEVMTLTYQDHSPRERPGLGTLKHTKPDTQESSNKSVSGPITISGTEPGTSLVPTEILKSKAKPYPPCTHCGFNDHHPDDCKNYLKHEIYGSYDHFTSRHNRVIYVRGGVLDESSECSEASIGVSYNTCGSNRHIRELIWYLDSGCSRSMTGVKSYLQKYVEQPGPKQGTIFYANKEIVLIALIRNDVHVLDMSSLTPNAAASLPKPQKVLNHVLHVKRKAKKSFFQTKQNFSIKKCLHLLHVDLFGPVSPMSINHEKYTLVIIVEYSSFCDEKVISHNFFFPYKPKQNGIAEMKNKTLIEAARIILNGSVLSKQSWNKTVRIVCYTQNRSITVKRHDKTPYEILRERILDISYFHIFGCPVFIHNHKDHLGKIDAKANDGYFLAYLFNSKAFRVFNTRRQQIKETYHVTYDKSMEAIGFTNTLVNEIRINDSSRYPLDEFLQENDLSRQYQANSDISYYIIPHGRSLTELTQDTHVPEVITSNAQDTPHTEDDEESSRNNIQTSVPITEPLVPEVPQSQSTNHASTSSYPVAQDRWSRDQHIELLNIFSDPGEGMFTRSMATKLTVASTSGCLFADLLSEIEPKRNMKDKHGIVTKNKARLVDQGYSQEEGINYDETFAPLARIEAIWIFLDFATYMNFIVFQMDVKSAFLNVKLKDEVYVKQPPGFESSEFPHCVCNLDKALYGLKQAPMACYKLCKQFEKLMTKKFQMSMMGELTYFLRLQIKQDDKGISICQELYTRNLLKKYGISNSSSIKTLMVPPKNLGPDLANKPFNETLYRGMIRSLMHLTANRPDIPFSTCLCARYHANLKESHLIDVKRIFRYLNGTLSLGLWYPKCSAFDLKGYSDPDYARWNMDRKITSDQLLDYCLLTGTMVDIGGSFTVDIVTRITAKSGFKNTDKDSEEILNHSLIWNQSNPQVTAILGIVAKTMNHVLIIVDIQAFLGASDDNLKKRIVMMMSLRIGGRNDEDIHRAVNPK
ncbi:retrovirus-related pol polyprotein from transposon TNT 1-94 [Tanacetum coccineum]